MLLSYQKKSLIITYLFLFFSIIFFLYYFLNFNNLYFLETIKNGTINKKIFINLMFSGCAALGALGFILTKGYMWILNDAWKWVLLLSILLLGLLIGILFADNYIDTDHNHIYNIIMHNQKEVDTYLDAEFQKLEKMGLPVPVKVPISCFLQWMEISPNGKLKVIGFAYQQFDEKTALLKSKEVFFPEAFEQSFTEVSRFKKNNKEIVGYRFVAQFMMDDLYTKYPGDKFPLLFELGFKKFDQNVILVPFFNAYNIDKLNNLIGILPDYVLENWKIENSNFGYYNSPNNTTYGAGPGMVLQTQLPTLTLSLLIKRNFFYPLVYSFTPLIIIFFVLFFMSIFIGLEKLTFSQIIGFSLGVLVATLVSQDAYVKSMPILAQVQYTFVNYAFFLGYFYGFIICIDGMLYYSSEKDHWIFVKYRNNMLIRLIYWPSLLIFMIIGALFIFY